MLSDIPGRRRLHGGVMAASWRPGVARFRALWPIALFTAALSFAATPAQTAPTPSSLVVWAWERPEDLRFLSAPAEAAVLNGFVEFGGARVRTRGRRFPLRVDADRVTTALVHVQIDRTQPLVWSAAMRAVASAAVLSFAKALAAKYVQVDFETRRSERHVLLDLLSDVRAGLPASTRLSMTALASWCDEDWVGQAPVDEIAPMLFRMGRGGDALKARLAAGGDFRDPHCRKALAVSSDAPISRAPSGRRVYLFSPRSWTAADFDAASWRVTRWGRAGD